MKKIFSLIFLFSILVVSVQAQSTYAPNYSCSHTYNDISSTGTSIGAMGDDGETNVSMPFSFTFYGITSTDLRVGNNGGILFDVTTGNVGTANSTLNGSPDAGIYPFWDDLYTGGDVYYETVGVAPNRIFIIQWDRNHYDCQGGNGSFQVQLFEITNEVAFLYDDLYFEAACSSNDGGTATVGIEGTVDFINSSYNSAYSNTCVSYVPCTPPTVNITQTCSADFLTYDLEINVTDLGGASGVDISDEFSYYWTSVGVNSYTITGFTAASTIYVTDDAVAGCEYSEAFAICDICTASAIPTDECAGAPLIDLSQSFAGSTNCSYTESAGSPSACGMTIENDSWITFIAGSTDVEMDYEVGDCSPIDEGVQLAVFSGTCGSLSLLPSSCVNPTGENTTGTWNFSGMTIGETYYIRIDGYAGDLCGYSFTPVAGVVITPDNDECADAITLTCGSSDIASNILATDVDAPAGCTNGGTPTEGVWYTFTGTGAPVTISTDNTETNLDTEINIFEGPCGSLVCVGGDNDGGTTPGTSEYTFTATNGTEYYIYVDGFDTEVGQFEISLNCCSMTPGITNNTGTTELDCTTTSISVTATGGNTYAWSGGATPSTAANSFSTSGTYTVTVTDALLCTETQQIVITQDNTPPSVGISNVTGTTELSCITTLIDVTASGGGTYAWSGGSTPATSANSFNSIGTYYVTVTAANGCTNSQSIEITQNTTPPTVGITNNTGSTVIDCTNLSISLTATGGGTYAWSGGSSTNTSFNTVSTPNTYTVTVTAVNGCTDTESVIITQNLSTPTAGITNNTGTTALDCLITSISLTATGGLSYSWNGGSSSNTAANSVSTPTTYIVTVTAANGCTDTESILITQTVTPPTAGITNNTGATVLDCNNTSISLTATGGDTYAWSGGATPSTAANSVSLPATYTVTVTASNGCTDTENVIITQDVSTPTAGITNNTGSTVIDCNNSTISLTATGGGTYAWSGGSSPSTAANLISSPNTYTLTVTGANGCVDTDNIVITQDLSTPTAGITNNTGTTSLDCVNTSISLTATGGSTYAWSGGSSTNTASNTITTPSSYIVTVTGVNGCTDTESILVTQTITPPIAGITNNTGVSVLDCNNSTILLTATGGGTYSWSGGATPGNSSNSVSTPATYTVTVTAANGCTDTESVIITQDISTPMAGITNNTGSTIIDCNNSSISLIATGGGTYAWSGGATPSTAANSVSTPSTYTVMVTASNGCTDTDNITITQDLSTPTAGITNNTGSTELTCVVNTISLTATGGGTYAWSAGSSTNTDSNTVGSPDTYTVTVTGANGCVDTENIVITQSADFPTVVITNNTGTTVLDCNNTSISVIASGGVSYSWSGGSLTGTAINDLMAPGLYTVSVTATNGCVGTEFINITQDIALPTVLITNNTFTTTLNCEVTSISLTASGGDSYEWNAGLLLNTANNIVTAPFNYVVTVTGSNGCEASNSVLIDQDVTPVSADITNNTGTTELTCSINSILLTASGGDSYEWNAGSSTNTAGNTVTSSGTYTVTVTSSNGCADTYQIIITQSGDVPTAAINNNTGSSELNCIISSISLTASGGNTYVWSGGETTGTASNTIVTPGTYIVTVTAINGCTDTESILIIQDIVTPLANIVNNIGTSILDCATTMISLTATGGSDYIWSDGSSILTADNSVSSPDTYSVTVTADNGCIASENITITQDVEIPSLELGEDITVCESEVPVMFDAGSGYSYDWSTSDDTQTISVSTEGMYTVTITADNSCTASDNVNLYLTDLTIPTFESFGAYCIDQAADMLPESSNNSIDGSWTPSSINTSVAGSNTYLFVADNGQCADNFSLEVSVNSEIIPVFDSFGPYCEGEEAGILPNKSNNNIDGSWEPTVINTLESGEGSYLFTPTDIGGCTSTASVLISIYALPQISISSDATEMYSDESLGILVSGADSYSWYPEGVLSCDDCSDPLFYSPAIQTTDSVFEFYVSGTSNSCTSVDTLRITVLGDIQLLIPQGFSPNGDGRGDTWNITGIERYPSNVLYVYNRWGALVYSKDAYRNEWDGKIDSGETLPAGTYYYVLKLTGNEVDVYKGYVYINY